MSRAPGVRSRPAGAWTATESTGILKTLCKPGCRKPRDLHTYRKADGVLDVHPPAGF